MYNDQNKSSDFEETVTGMPTKQSLNDVSDGAHLISRGRDFNTEREKRK